MSSGHLVNQAGDILHTLRDWSYPITIAGYYLAVTVACLDGAWSEIAGHRGHVSKIHRMLWQWHTGSHLHPLRTFGDERRLKRTASASQRATPEGSIVYWSKMKRPHRALRNNAITVLILTALYGLVFDRLFTVEAVAASCVVGLFAATALLLYRARHKVAKHAPAKLTVDPFIKRSPVKVVEPVYSRVEERALRPEPPKLTSDNGVPPNVLALQLSEPLACSPAETETLLHIGPDEGDLDLPDHFPALTRQKEVVEEIIRGQMPGPVSMNWRTSSVPRRLSWKPMVTNLPRVVRFRDYLEQLEALPQGDFGNGVMLNGSVYVVSHNGDTPWWLRSAASGTGKSTAFQIKLAQVCRKDPGAQVYGIDTKQVSFEPMKGIPNFHLFNDPEAHMADIYDVFYMLMRTMRHRYSAIRQGKASPDDFEDIWLFVDEGDDLAGFLSSYYLQNLKPAGGSNSPPVWTEAIAPILKLGRQVGIRGELMYQNMTDRVLGNISLRSVFQGRGMAGYDKTQWNRIIGSGYEPPKMGQGRICMVRGADHQWVQGFYDEPEYLFEYALAGRKPVAA